MPCEQDLAVTWMQAVLPNGEEVKERLASVCQQLKVGVQNKWKAFQANGPSTKDSLEALVARRPPTVERFEHNLDKFVATVLDIWCRTAGRWLAGSRVVNLMQERPLAESAPLIAVGLIMGTLYVSFSWAYLPAAHLPLSSTSSVVFHSSFIMAVLSYERGITIDPGFIPDNWQKSENGRPIFEGEGGIVFMHERKKKTGDLRFCNKEMKFKPDRAHYCSAMRRNVLRMDHYCPWLANCVGYHNHKFFFLFLFYTLIATGTLDVGVIRALHCCMHSAGHTFMMGQGAVISTLLTVLLGPFFGFHCWLMRHNMTTIEYCEKRRDNDESRMSHYDIGVYKNIQCVLGDNWMLWLLPMSGPSGDGLQWGVAEMRPATPAVEEPHAAAAAPAATSEATEHTSRQEVRPPKPSLPACVPLASEALGEICGDLVALMQNKVRAWGFLPPQPEPIQTVIQVQRRK